MLRTRTSIAALAATLATFAVACGGEDPSNPGTGGGGTGGGSGETVGLPPPPKEGAPAGDGEGQAFAISKIYVGDTNRAGSKSPSAWKDFGFNLDGMVSNGEEAGHCKPVEGAPNANAVRTDGNNGIDNSFGQLIVPKLVGIVGDLSSTATNEIQNGTFTVMLDIQKLGAGADYNGLESRLYAGAILDAPPKFDGTDEWPVVPELLNGGDVNNPKIKFTDSYVVGNTFVSGAPTPITLNLAFGDVTVDITINKALVAMDLSADRKSATNGIIAGVVETEVLLEELRKLAKTFDPTFCDPENPTLKTVENAIRQASDIMADGSQDPNQTCNAISIGIGFDAAPVKIGAVAPETPVEENPCEGQ